MAGKGSRVRMSAGERRQQLLGVGREVFARKGYDSASIEEIAQRAGVSKPVVYEHFGGKHRLYAAVVDREVRALLERITEGLIQEGPKQQLQQAALALLGYIEDNPQGFRILIRDSPAIGSRGNYASVVGDVATQVEHIFAAHFKSRGFDPKLAPLYSHALVGMVALVGEWWLDAGEPDRKVVAAHLANLAWNGLKGLDRDPSSGYL